MSKSILSARINKFMDSKRGLIDLSLISEQTTHRSRRKLMEVSDTPFIELAIR